MIGNAFNHDMKAKRIVISVIGNFKIYSKAAYIPSFCGNMTEIESTSSTIVVARAAEAAKIIALIPFSLSATVCPQMIQTGDTENAKKSLSEAVKKFLRSGYSVESEIVPMILPNSGSYRIADSDKILSLRYEKRSEHSKERTPSVFFGAVFYSIYTYLQGENEFELYLDVTHAMNNLILDTVNAVRLALRTLSAVSGAKISLIIVHSDPFLQQSNVPLHIREYSKENMNKRDESLSILLSNFVYNYNNSRYNDALSCMKLPKWNKNVLRNLAKCHNLGALLPTASFADLLKTWREKLREVLSDIPHQPHQDQLSLGERGIEIRIDELMLTEISNAFSVLEALTTSEFSLGEKACILDLMKSADLLVEPGKTILKNELDKLSKNGEIKNGRTPLSNYYEWGNLKTNSRACKSNTRNFIAHGGLEANLTWVIKESEKLYLSYDCCLDFIYSKILSGKGI
jgi:CRISPR-associated protein Csx1